MSEVLAALSVQDLLAELDAVERAIARSSTFHRWIDATGRSQIRVSPDLLILAEREQHITTELKRRRRASVTA
jgi:thiamine biosynthesis lipoprotein ApbE